MIPQIEKTAPPLEEKDRGPKPSVWSLPVAMTPVAMAMMMPVPVAEAQIHTRRVVAVVIAAAAPLTPPVMAVSAMAVTMVAVHLLDRGASGRRLCLRREWCRVGAE